MAYLALDCTGETFSCGLVTDKGVFTEVVGLSPRRALLELPGHISHLMQNSGVTTDRLRGVGVPVGPGSFTGVRLGIALAKTVAYASGCGVCAVDTLECLARQVGEGFSHARGTVAVALDARRKELYCGLFSSDDSRVLVPTDVRTPELFRKALNEQSALLALVGAGFEAYPDLVPESFRGPVLSSRSQTALSMHTLCRLTRDAAESGSLQPFGQIEPAYHRKADIQVSG